MEYNTRLNHESKSLSHLVKDLGGSIKNLAASEINLMKEESKANTSTMAAQLTKVAIYASLIFFGSLALLTFLIIGLGNFLNHQFWLSSLLIAVALLAIGSLKIPGAFRAINWRLWTLPHSQESLRRDVSTMAEKIGEITKAFERRAA
ncbi:MAG: phage holin family protein [Bdellovibrionota bacterium]